MHINSVKDKSLLKATIYMSLEPCSHFGKTPPCSDLIIKKWNPQVVIGTVDPNKKWLNGIKISEAGNKGDHSWKNAMSWTSDFTFHQKKRPYIILKWAESQDGFISQKVKSEQKPVWIIAIRDNWFINGEEEQAILVGTQTVIDDNPKLDERLDGKQSCPNHFDQKIA
jgi:diaminohydroxyphosphoribosylaminopyrimidine deaminase/5-amino-6-(5-phosphoribosylamino)uracil reductase